MPLIPKIITVTLNPSLDKNSGVDHVVSDWKLRCDEPFYDAGGGGLNVSKALKRLGVKSEALFVAGGPPGQMLQHFIRKDKLQSHLIPIRGWTRENFSVIEKQTGQQFRFNMPGPDLEKAEWTSCLNKLKELAAEADYIIASGSLPPGIPVDFYSRLARQSKKNNTKIILDISGAALEKAVGKGAFMLKMNLRELCGLVGRELRNEVDYKRAAKELMHKRAADLLIISLGHAGAIMASPKVFRHFQAPFVPVKSCVGAGDSMVAGFVLGLIRHDCIERASLMAVAAGSAAVMTPNTELCRKRDVERLYRQLWSKYSR